MSNKLEDNEADWSCLYENYLQERMDNIKSQFHNIDKRSMSVGYIHLNDGTTIPIHDNITYIVRSNNKKVSIEIGGKTDDTIK